jgi:hypothetical protein
VSLKLGLGFEVEVGKTWLDGKAHNILTRQLDLVYLVDLDGARRLSTSLCDGIVGR